MKAAVFHACGGPDVIRVEERPDPEPGPGEVRVDVRAAALPGARRALQTFLQMVTYDEVTASLQVSTSFFVVLFNKLA